MDCSFHHPETERRPAEARSLESHKQKNDLIEKLEEERDNAQRDLQLLASEMVYKGNSIQHIHAKMAAYKDIVFAVCEAFRSLGYKGEFGDTTTLPQRLQEFADSLKQKELETLKGKEMSDGSHAVPQIQTPKTEITIDQEAWLENRIRKAIRMAQALKSKCSTGPDNTVYDKALEGIVGGTIEEILNIFNLKLKD